MPEEKTVDQEIVLSSDHQINALLNDIIDRLKVYTESQVQHINKLAKIGVALSSIRNLDRLLEMILDEARAFTRADAGTLYLVDQEEQTIKYTIVQTESMGIRMGGATGQPIDWPPVPMTVDGKPNDSNVCAYVANSGKMVNIPDVYEVDGFDFQGPRKFDKDRGYRTKSMMVFPMRNHEGEIIGVMQLINALDPDTGERITFAPELEELSEALASQAAVALTNAELISNLENLFGSFVKVMATAIDEKSPVTAGHIKRVADMTMVMAKTINGQKEGPYADVTFDEDQLHELRTAAWMHDIGKVTTPVQIVEKGKKLQTIFDRVHFIGLRFLYFAKSVEADALKKKYEMSRNGASDEEIEKFDKETEEKIKEIMDSREFVMSCNEPGEFMSDDKIERLQNIAKTTYVENGQTASIINEDELLNLSIRKGSITEPELKKMQDHAAISLKMLEQIPFTKKLKNIPLFAGAHHEYINGKGYPRGLRGDEIPLEARMLAILDITEALTASDRPYKKPMPVEQAHKILGFMVKDGELDGHLVDLLVKEKVYERYLEEYKEKD